MDFNKSYNSSDEYRRDELIRRIERALSNLTLDELEALHYDMITKNYINETSLWLTTNLQTDTHKAYEFCEFFHFYVTKTMKVSFVQIEGLLK